MKENISAFDGFFRMLIGMVGFILALYFNWWWGLIGLLLVASAAAIYCPLYDLLGINTNDDDKSGSHT